MPNFNHMKLVSRGDNPNKKSLMYIPCVTRDHTLDIHNYIVLE